LRRRNTDSRVRGSARRSIHRDLYRRARAAHCRRRKGHPGGGICEALARHERGIEPAGNRRSRRRYVEQVASVAIAIRPEMEEYAGGFVLGTGRIKTIRQKG